MCNKAKQRAPTLNTRVCRRAKYFYFLGGGRGVNSFEKKFNTS